MELAAVLPMLAALTLALVGVVLLAGDQVLVTAAAREGARAAALGEPNTQVDATTRAALPGRGRSAEIRVQRVAPDQVSVRVRLPARLAGQAGLTISATAVAAVEPAAPPPDPGAGNPPTARSTGSGAPEAAFEPAPPPDPVAGSLPTTHPTRPGASAAGAVDPAAPPPDPVTGSPPTGPRAISGQGAATGWAR